MGKGKEPDILDTFDVAFGFAEQQVRRLVERHRDQFVAHTVQGRWALNPLARAEVYRMDGPTGASAPRDPLAWSGAYNGLLPGMMWIFHEETGDAWWAETAERYSRAVEIQKDMPEAGLGLVFYHGSHRRWHETMVRANSPQQAVVDAIHQAARSLAKRFSEPARCLLMGRGAPVLAIEDLMNVPLILYAAGLCGDDDLLGVGSRHVATSRRHLVRGDGSTAAFALVGERPGEYPLPGGEAGCRGDSCWARGQAWAVYGFATCGRLLEFGPWLDTARQCAGYLVERLSGDPIPSWDLDAGVESDGPRDSSAAAIAAAGLLELASAEQTVGTEQAKQRRYLQDAALRILAALCDPTYLAIDDPGWEGILKHGVGDLEKGLAVGESLIWGDFFFTDALQRARRLLRAKHH